MLWPTVQKCSPLWVPVRLSSLDLQPLLSSFLLHLLCLLCLLKAQLSLTNFTRQETSNKRHKWFFKIFLTSQSSCRSNNILDDNGSKEMSLLPDQRVWGRRWLNDRRWNQYCSEGVVSTDAHQCASSTNKQVTGLICGNVWHVSLQLQPARVPSTARYLWSKLPLFILGLRWCTCLEDSGVLL